MKKITKVATILAAVLIIAIATADLYVKKVLPDTGEATNKNNFSPRIDCTR